MDRKHKNKIILSGFILAVLLVTLASAGNLLVNTQSDIIFSHKFHIDKMEVECTACHIDIESSLDASDRNLPSMEECSACHDVEDDENCGMCHKNVEEPEAVNDFEHDFLFNHKFHIENGIDCKLCHETVYNSEQPMIESIPNMASCMDCHNGEKAPSDCALCHGEKIEISDIHPGDWKHQHGDQANQDKEYCQSCHKNESFCLSCHFGDNIIGNIHDLNYQFTHGLDAQNKTAECQVCHVRKSFCVSCHESGLRMPLAHSAANWIVRHGKAARNDIENCASCHQSDDPTCGLSGCHNDYDGIRGTNPKIHRTGGVIFDSEGYWHEDNGSYCYQCHINTRQAGQGFCGYCHGREGD